MRIRMIQKDLMRNKAVAIAMIAFIAIAAALLSMVAILGTNLFGAIDGLMIEAKAPHFMQMHSGDLDFTQLDLKQLKLNLYGIKDSVIYTSYRFNYQIM